jgi:hypothetical protein
VGNYAFAAAPDHPFIADALDEAMARTKRLIQRAKEDESAVISDDDVLLSTGPYMLSELYHEGRRSGKYADVAHIRGDDGAPSRRRSYGGNDWHKFGGYAEHMLTHSWVTSARRRMQDTYDLYGTYDTYGGDVDYDCILACPGVEGIEDVYMLVEESMDLYYGTDLGVCIEACTDGNDDGNEYLPEDMVSTDRVMPEDDSSSSGAFAAGSSLLVSLGAMASIAMLLGSLLC